MTGVPVRVVAADITTGRRLIDVPFTGGSFDDALNDTGSLTVTVPIFDVDVRALNLQLTGAPAHTLLGCTYDDTFVQGGPIWAHEFDRDKQVLQLKAANTWSYLNHRAILPQGDDSTSLILPTGAANPAMNTALTGLDLGSIARFVAKQANDNRGIPIFFQDARTGSAARTYLGSDLKSVGDALKDLTEVDGGPDIRFDMSWTQDRLGLQILMRTGTAAQPRLFSNARPRWDYSVSQKTIRNLTVSVDAQDMGDTVFTTGGRVRDVLLVDRRSDGGVLAGRGYPRMDIVDTSHSSVDDQATLTAYGQENLRLASAPTAFWEFEVRTDAPPYFGSYGVGDYCDIVMRGDPYIPDGIYTRRIVQLSGDLNGKWVKVSTGEVIGNV